MSNALFIDAGNLNVLYKVDGRFSLGVSYMSCPEKLVTDVQALGSSYDVYVSLWPRIPSEADSIIQELSVGGVPFGVLGEEIKAVLNFVEKFPGVNNIYLCNALANFVIPARVSNFHAVLRYGSRFALVEVSDNLLSGLRVFDSQKDFYNKMGEDFSCYGDIDIVDVDTIRAQYPEFVEHKRNNIVPLVHLIVSYRSAYKVSADEVREQFFGAESTSNPTLIEEPPKEREKKVTSFVGEKPAVSKAKTKQAPAKRGIDVVSLLLAGVFCVCMLLLGIGYSMRNVEQRAAFYSVQQQLYQSEVSKYSEPYMVYLRETDMAKQLSDLLSFVKSSGLDVNVLSAEGQSDQITVMFNCSDLMAKDHLVSMMETKYTVLDVTEFGTVPGEDGLFFTQYGITLLL